MLGAHAAADTALTEACLRRSYKCRWLKSDAAFTWACIKLGLRIQLAAAALRINGNVRASRKVRTRHARTRLCCAARASCMLQRAALLCDAEQVASNMCC